MLPLTLGDVEVCTPSRDLASILVELSTGAAALPEAFSLLVLVSAVAAWALETAVELLVDVVVLFASLAVLAAT